MRHLTVLACLVAFLAVVRTPPLEAQASSSPLSSSLLSPPNALPAPSAATSDHSEGHTFLRRIGTGIGAALIGAGMGYLLSEVALGDWDQRAGRGSIQRSVWVGVGGGAAFAFGFAFPIGGRGGSPGKLPTGMFGGRSVITAKEIEGSGATTALDAVRSLRPEWLQRRQTHFLQSKDESTIPVYLGAQYLGGLDELSTISAQNVKVMYRYTAAQATILQAGGSGSVSGAVGTSPQGAEGAIQVITKE